MDLVRRLCCIKIFKALPAAAVSVGAGVSRPAGTAGLWAGEADGHTAALCPLRSGHCRWRRVSFAGFDRQGDSKTSPRDAGKACKDAACLYAHGGSSGVPAAAPIIVAAPPVKPPPPSPAVMCRAGKCSIPILQGCIPLIIPAMPLWSCGKTAPPALSIAARCFAELYQSCRRPCITVPFLVQCPYNRGTLLANIKVKNTAHLTDASAVQR